MLAKNHIPYKEPRIRVGIILPEDHFNEISVKIPGKLSFVAASEHGEQISHGEELHFKLSQGTVLLNNILTGSRWMVRSAPDTSHLISARDGFKVQNVIAGRGFHWQKYIDVYLPGALEISVYEKNLVLINELPLEQYLMCVATSEMGAACPAALLEAQTIVARSWILANVEQKHADLGMDVCNDDCCQRYQGTGNLTEHSIAGALATRGQVLLFEDQVCDARYSKSCGGIMESFATIWGDDELPYLKNLPDKPADNSTTVNVITDEEAARAWIDQIPPGFCSPHSVPEQNLIQYLGSVDENGTYYRWQMSYTGQELCDLLNEQLKIDANYITDLKAISRGGSGRIKKLLIEFEKAEEKRSQIILERDVAIRQALHKGFLYSSCIYFDLRRDESGYIRKAVIHGAGWGHGVGLCQIGALGMALKGYSSAEIVAHYYPGSRLEKIF